MDDPFNAPGPSPALNPASCARRPDRRLARLAPIAAAVGLTACATAPRSDNEALARSGLDVTGTMAGDINDLSQRLMQGDVQNAFSTTWTVCEANPPLCGPKTPAGALSAARERLSTTIVARARALAALNSAYGALAAEAAYDAHSDASAAVHKAFEAAQTYATIAGAGAIPALAGGVASYGAGLLADRAQARRLRDDNIVLANAVNLMAAGLAREQADFDRIAAEIVQEEVEASGALVGAGLISATPGLTSLAGSLDATLVKDPDAVLAKSASARAASQAVVLASASGKTAALKARYAASLSALEELKRQHVEASNDKPLDLSALNQRLAELDSLLGQLKAR